MAENLERSGGDSLSFGAMTSKNLAMLGPVNAVDALSSEARKSALDYVLQVQVGPPNYKETSHGING